MKTPSVTYIYVNRFWFQVRSVPRVVEALGETNCGSLEDAVVKRLKVSVEDFEKFIEMIEQVQIYTIHICALKHELVLGLFFLT